MGGSLVSNDGGFIEINNLTARCSGKHSTCTTSLKIVEQLTHLSIIQCCVSSLTCRGCWLLETLVKQWQPVSALRGMI